MSKYKLHRFRIIYYLVPFLIWEVLSFIFGSSNFPHITSLVTYNIDLFKPEYNNLYNTSLPFVGHLFVTFKVFSISIIIGLLGGYLFGILLLINKKTKDFFKILFNILKVIPPLILIPLFIIINSFNVSTDYLIVIIYTTFVLASYVLQSGIEIDNKYSKYLDYLSADKFSMVLNIYSIGVLPSVIGGIRISISYSMGILIITEYLSGNSGLGSLIKNAVSFGDIKLIILCILYSIFISLIFDLFVSVGSILFLKWSPRYE